MVRIEVSFLDRAVAAALVSFVFALVPIFVDPWSVMGVASFHLWLSFVIVTLVMAGAHVYVTWGDSDES